MLLMAHQHPWQQGGPDIFALKMHIGILGQKKAGGKMQEEIVSDGQNRG